MHSSVLKVWKNRLPGLPTDSLLSTKEGGLLVPISTDKKRKSWAREKKAFNGMPAWAEIEGKSLRMLVQFDAVVRDFSFPEMFRQNARQAKARAASERKARKAERDRRFKDASRLVADSKDRSEAEPDERIVPFPVRMGVA